MASGGWPSGTIGSQTEKAERRDDPRQGHPPGEPRLAKEEQVKRKEDRGRQAGVEKEHGGREMPRQVTAHGEHADQRAGHARDQPEQAKEAALQVTAKVITVNESNWEQSVAQIVNLPPCLISEVDFSI